VPAGVVLNTPALINAQNFFNPVNYLGHVVYNTLAISPNFLTQGGCPGTINDGTSINCGRIVDFALRLRRRHTFAPGNYQFTIAADDGIRFSVDSGVTWILDSFIEQQFGSSFRTTATRYPGGICLSGPTDLVIEYFQRPSETRFDFTVTPLSATPVTQPRSDSACTGGNAVFTFGGLPTGTTYQWQVSNDNGATFTSLFDDNIYTNTTTASLTLRNILSTMNGYVYRCIVTNSCANNVASNAATLTVAEGVTITTQPTDVSLCEAPSGTVSVVAAGINLRYQWQRNTGSGYQPINSDEGRSSSLPVDAASNPTGTQFQCLVSGDCGFALSNVATLRTGQVPVITTQPTNQVICGDTVTFSVGATGSGLQYTWSISTDGGQNFAPTVPGAPFANDRTAALRVSPVRAQNGWQFQVQVTSDYCGGLSSAPARLIQCGDTCQIAPLGNLITADSDTLNNEFFEPRFCDFESFSLKVYNRWGREVFSSTDASKIWNGTRNGESPAGTYFYTLTYTIAGNKTEKRGYVEVVR
jgi:gliding motility-associated-like protein